jgi:signal transduction histidine kinase/CheY-like chemotaxis protein
MTDVDARPRLDRADLEQLLAGLTAVRGGDFSVRLTETGDPLMDEIATVFNGMADQLRESVEASHEQDWLKSNLASIGSMMQGHRDLEIVADLIMEELVPLLGAQHGTFFIAEDIGGETRLRLIAGYGLRADKNAPIQYRIGQALIGQVAKSKRLIVVDDIPPGYIKISSGLGEAPPANLAVLPIMVEDQVLGVVELASFTRFSRVQTDFLEQLTEGLGVSVNAIIANARTDALLEQSQRLTAELQARSEELQARSEELQRSNAELEDKAALLATQKRDIEAKNAEIERARGESEERARQLTLASQYKSQFLANMSHELRTPLNSLLILARLLAQNPGQNLTPKQVEYANVIHSAGSDLLQLINDILDLSKVEAGRMDIHAERFALSAFADDIQTTFGPLTAEKGLMFAVDIDPSAPAELCTDRQRLRQVLANLLSNAVKFTERGEVRLRVRAPEPDGPVVEFSVTDTGIGIAPENLAAIFGAFQQGDGTLSRRYGGTGLGLSIAREVAALLGGEITAESDLSRGSTFALYIPRALPGPPAELAPPERKLLVFEGTSGGLLTLLAHGAVSDLTDINGTAGVSTATSPAQGISLLTAEPFRCVVVDLGLPSALEFLDQIQQKPQLRKVPVLAHTSGKPEASAQARLAVLRAGHTTVELLPSLDGLRERITLHLSAAQPGVVPALVSDTVSAPVASQHAGLRGKKVLVIDDDTRNVFAISSTLELFGVTVAQAPDGQAGIEALIAEPDVNLILMDVMMPGMDGYATMTAIRKMPQFADLPIIAVTARAMPGDRDKSLSAGASGYVTKPVDTEELLVCMERWLIGS